MTKTAFVTGATAGIGEATVRALVAGGWRCVATGRRSPRTVRALVTPVNETSFHEHRTSQHRTSRRAVLDSIDNHGPEQTTI